MTTEASGGAKGKTAVTPVVAVAVTNNETLALLGAHDLNELKLGGDYEASPRTRAQR